jgi:hypothetical protein
MRIGWSRRGVLLTVLAVDVVVVATGVGVALAQGTHALSHLGQDGYTTYVSVAQLLGASGLAWLVFSIRRSKYTSDSRPRDSLIWAILATGLAFLAADQAFEIHDRMASLVITGFSLDTSRFPVEAGDIMVGTYGLIGGLLLLLYRAEMKLFREALPLLIAVAALLACTVALDLITGEGSLLRQTTAYVSGEVSWISALKDTLTIAAGGVLIGLIYYCVDVASRMRPDQRR